MIVWGLGYCGLAVCAEEINEYAVVQCSCSGHAAASAGTAAVKKSHSLGGPLSHAQLSCVLHHTPVMPGTA